jgi:prevent-host-death family protein
MTSPTPDHWQIQDAKRRFSEMIRAVASEGPQVITRHGEDVVDTGEYRRLTRPAVDLTGVLLGGPRLSDDGAAAFTEVQTGRKADFGRSTLTRPHDLPSRHERIPETRRRQPPANVVDWIAATPPDRLHVSVLTLGETEQGIAKIRGRGDRHQASGLEHWPRNLVLSFTDHERLTTLTPGDRCCHVRPSGVSAVLTVALGCSPSRP